KRKIRSQAESQLADALLRGDIRDGDKVVMTYDKSANAVLVQKLSPAEAEARNKPAREPAHA
ncbi:hypothetical protein, partial [Caballeronia mineralivorans]|uniref:hypothetical protein n=1 Tax=Caballeronia mineralivorans TaxID=2010198 RepID=UPI002AFE8916